MRDGYFDVWLPALAPSTKLLARFKKHRYTDDPAADRAFFDIYEWELLATAESRQTVQFVAQVAARIPISVGCFCGDEARCHRSHLVKIIQKHAPSE